MENYTPSARFNNVQYLYTNHFRFVIRDMPDLTQFVTGFVLPSVACPAVGTHINPFVAEPNIGDHMIFEPFNVQFIVDAKFLSYFSLFHWMTGTAFPTGYEDIGNFTDWRKPQLPQINPRSVDIFKTSATLTLLTPDTDAPIIEIEFEDCFPTALGELSFSTTQGDTMHMTCMASFTYTRFEPKRISE